MDNNKIMNDNKIMDKIQNNNFVSPQVYNNKLSTLKNKLPHILDDFKKYFVFYNKNPEYDEYKRSFENIKANLNTLNTDILNLSNNVNKNIKELNKQLIEVNLLIKKEKIINRKLKHKLGLVEKKNNATTELISDYDLMYNINYLRNFGLFICILISGYAISKIKNNN
jgi:hypothetical protein